MEYTLSGLDPRSRLLCAFFLSIAIACLERVESALFSLLLAFSLLFLTRPPLSWAMHRILGVNVFIGFIWLFVPWTTPGKTIWEWGILHASAQGINLALLATIKANAIACVFLALAAPLSIPQWGSALHSFKFPDKLIWLFLLMGGNIFILRSQWQTLIQAAKLRGFKVRTNIRTYYTIASMFAILLIRAHERALKVHEAMLLRGFSGRLPYICQNTLGISDIIFAMVIFLFIILLYVIDFGFIYAR